MEQKEFKAGRAHIFWDIFLQSCQIIGAYQMAASDRVFIYHNIPEIAKNNTNTQFRYQMWAVIIFFNLIFENLSKL